MIRDLKDGVAAEDRNTRLPMLYGIGLHAGWQGRAESTKENRRIRCRSFRRLTLTRGLLIGLRYWPPRLSGEFALFWGRRLRRRRLGTK
jgi:hypothetical protein